MSIESNHRNGRKLNEPDKQTREKMKVAVATEEICELMCVCDG